MSKKPASVLRCILCPRKFSEEDVKSYNFFPRTSCCFDCYKDLAQKPYSHTCFGKPNVTKGEKIVRFGYDPAASEDCRTHCPQKEICKLFYKKRIYNLRKFAVTPFFGTTADVFRKGLKGLQTRLAVKKLTKYEQRQVGSGKKGSIKWLADQSKRVFKIYYIKRAR